MKYENEDGCNKSDILGSAEPFVKAPWLTRQFYGRPSVIFVTAFIAEGLGLRRETQKYKQPLEIIASDENKEILMSF